MFLGLVSGLVYTPKESQRADFAVWTGVVAQVAKRMDVAVDGKVQ